jgi:DNA-binding transcriptional MerR regulator
MNNKANSGGAVHKIGAISTLSGVPSPTLRIWELRYGTFAPQKSQGQHRLYTDDDVLRATLLKRLTERGHAISSLAQLSSQELNALLVQGQDASRSRTDARLAGQPASMVVVGVALASRIESKKFTLSFIDQNIKVTNIFNDLSQALGATFERQVPFLLVKANSLHAGMQIDIHRLAQNCKAIQVIVLYSFGQESVIQVMKRSGMIVRKEPASDAELADLINSALLVGTEKESTGLVVGTVIPPRKYSELTLNRVANISTNVLCECPRHVAEIITQLANFEQYSHECLNKSAEDAHLHAYLSAVSGSARALFESALEMVANHEGIALHENVPE